MLLFLLLKMWNNVNSCLKIHWDIWEVKTGAFVIEVCWIHIGTDWFYQDNQHLYTHSHTETICSVVYRPHCPPSKRHHYLFKIVLIFTKLNLKIIPFNSCSLLHHTPPFLFICQLFKAFLLRNHNIVGSRVSVQLCRTSV